MGQHTWCYKKEERSFEEAQIKAFERLQDEIDSFNKHLKAHEFLTTEQISEINEIIENKTILKIHIKNNNLDERMDYWYDSIFNTVRELIWQHQPDDGDYINNVGYFIDCDYHDVFRTNKRNPDGSYIDDIYFTSKEECDKWMVENKDFIQPFADGKYYDEFWEKYPDGMIKFG